LEAIIVALLLLVMFTWREPKLHSLSVSITKAKKLLKDSWPLMLSETAIMIYMKNDQTILGQMIDDQAVGIYFLYF